MGDDQNLCGAEKDSGEACGNPIGLCAHCGRCRMHCSYSPSCDYDQKEVQASRARGGKKGKEKNIRTVEDDSAPPPPESARDAQEWASWTVWAVATGRIDARTAHELGYVIRAFLKSRETVELEEELQEFRDQVREELAGMKGQESLEVVD